MEAQKLLKEVIEFLEKEELLESFLSDQEDKGVDRIEMRANIDAALEDE